MHVASEGVRKRMMNVSFSVKTRKKEENSKLMMLLLLFFPSELNVTVYGRKRLKKRGLEKSETENKEEEERRIRLTGREAFQKMNLK